ncbi:MAG: polysaccharide biosynthesis/export family protein [Verrucomicrobiota bacterium]
MLGLLIAGAGCGGSARPATGLVPPPERGESRLRNGDQVTVRLDTGGMQPPQAIDVVIDENGEVGLPLVGRIKANGMTPAGLAEHIQASYVPRFYVRCTATVLATVRFFYMGGEVRSPGRFNWTEDITLLKAINTGGGFTDFANRRKVELTRGKVKTVFNAEDLRQYPEKDITIQPGDSLYVPRSIF